MTTHKMILAMLVGCCCMGAAIAAPEPTPKETKGQIVGQITQMNGGQMTVKSADSQLSLMPYWRGGMPKDGGGFDKDMLRQLEQFKVGDNVKVTWTFEEHYRIDTIERVEAAQPAAKAKQ